VDPEYPPAARSQSLQGMVHTLLTLDLSGHVSQAEALSGPELLRPAALDAVRQWSFRPVLRDGHPVYAYTDAIVDFSIDLDGAAKPARRAPDIAGEMAATERLAELRSRMPRSPEQVLADTEQQSSPVRGEERFSALPGLAKAALDAGSLDKAASYAHELLQQAEANTDAWNYGNAIHDGNMVLGLVALRSGDVAQAKRYLQAAGKTTGSPQLNSFGPNMRLAKELLEKGERDAVLDYFSLCRSFWKLGGASLDAWTAAVRAGQVPEFGANLLY
jgi:TonB family protein